MKTIRKRNYIAIALLAAVAFTTTIARAAGLLPSWNDGQPRSSGCRIFTTLLKNDYGCSNT